MNAIKFVKGCVLDSWNQFLFYPLTHGAGCSDKHWQAVKEVESSHNVCLLFSQVEIAQVPPHNGTECHYITQQVSEALGSGCRYNTMKLRYFPSLITLCSVCTLMPSIKLYHNTLIHCQYLLRNRIYKGHVLLGKYF